MDGWLDAGKIDQLLEVEKPNKTLSKSLREIKR